MNDTRENSNQKTTSRASEEIKAELFDYLDNDRYVFINLLEDLDNWNGYLQDERSYPMYMLEEYHQGVTLSEFLKNLTYKFSIDDDFFRYTIYGLESETEEEREDRYWANYGYPWIVDDILKYRAHINEIDIDLTNLLDELEQAIEEEKNN